MGRFDNFVIPPPASSGLGSRLDPRWKLAAALVAICAALVLHNLVALFVGLGASLVLAFAARVPGGWLMSRLCVVLTAVGLFALPLPFLIADTGPLWHLGPTTLSLRGAEVGCQLALRALTVVTLTLSALSTTRLDDLMKAARSLGLPSLLVQIALMAYRYLFVLGDELQRLRVAVRVRGFRNRATAHAYRTAGHVAGTLLVRGHERAERVHQAMLCRGFDGGFRSLTVFRTRLVDVVAFVLITGIAVGLALADRLLS